MGFTCKIFGHKWNCCKCERCGAIRDVGHKWSICEGKCIEKCEICGKEQKIEHTWNGCKCSRCGEVDFSFAIKPFTHAESLFHDSKLETEKKDALRKIIAEGNAGEKFLLDFMLRDVTFSGGSFILKNYGETAAAEWNKKRDIVLALSNTSDKGIIDELSEILLYTGRENQYAVVFQPAVAETLGNLKAYDALNILIASGQNVPAVALAKDILRLYKSGAVEKPENIRDEDGHTPLHNAVMNDDAELVCKLLEDGADIDVVCSRGRCGETALYIAVDRKNYEITKLLVENKANLSAMSWSASFAGTFPLQRAAAMGLFEIAKLLVENGADKQQKTLTGKTALMWAEQNGHANIAALLK